MVNKCVGDSCKSGYDSGENGASFGFPFKKDDFEQNGFSLLIVLTGNRLQIRLYAENILMISLFGTSKEKN